MKKNIFIRLLGVFLLCSGTVTAQAQAPADRTAAAVVAEVLARLPADNPSEYNHLMRALSATGAEGVQILVNGMHPPGKGDHAASEYALSGLAHYASGDEALKSKMEQACLEALEATEASETKAFILCRLAVLGSEACIHQLSGYLVDDKLSSPAACTIVSVGGEDAGKALQMALMRRNVRSSEVQRTIIQALGDVRPVTAGTEELLKSMLDTNDLKTKAVVLKALGKTGTKASLSGLAAEAAAAGYRDEITGATDAYIQLMKRAYEQGASKEVSAAAQSLLKNATKAGAPQIRIAALGLVFAVRPDPLKTLKKALNDRDRSYRNAALRYASGYADRAMYTGLFKMLPKAGKEEKTDVLNWIGDEAQCPAKRAILKTIETGIEKTGVRTLIEQLEHPDREVGQAAAFALSRIGNEEAVPALAGLLKSEDDRTVDLAKNFLSSFDGEISSSIVRIMGTASGEGRKVALELLALRKANSCFNVVLEQTKSALPEVQTAAYHALKDVVSEKDFVILCGLLETSGPDVVEPLQQAVISAISSLPPAGQAEIITRRMLQAGDSKKYLYYPVLASTGDPDALKVIAGESDENP